MVTIIILTAQGRLWRGPGGLVSIIRLGQPGSLVKAWVVLSIRVS